MRSTECYPLTIISSPMDMDVRGRIQENALRSWQKSLPGADILLLSDSRGVADMAESFGVRHYGNLDADGFGVPLVRSILSVGAEMALSDTVMYVNSDIILTPSMSDGILACRSRFGKFFGIGQRWDFDFPHCFRLLPNPGWYERMSRVVGAKGKLHARTGMDYFIYDRDFWSGVDIPDFSLGRMAWDGWLVATAVSMSKCPVVDMSEVVMIVHQNHPVGGGVAYDTEVNRNRQLGGRMAEIGTEVADKKLSTLSPNRPLDVYTEIYDSNYVAPLYALCGIPNSVIRDISPQRGRYDELSIRGREYLRLVDNIEDSQIVIFSTPWESVVDGMGTQTRSVSGVSRFVELSKKAKSAGKRVVVLYNSDDSQNLWSIPDGVPEPLVFRTSLSAKTRRENEWALPAWSSDILPDSVSLGLPGLETPTVSFCGLNTRVREMVLGVLESAEGVDTNFIRRDAFWGHLSVDDKRLWRHQYVDNMLSGDYALCVRGAGNFSYRLYEAMCCGRVPVLIDTDVVLPFEDYIPWDSLMIRVSMEEVGSLPDRLSHFHKYMQQGEWAGLRTEIRRYWEDWLSPLGFCRALCLVFGSIAGGVSDECR